MKIIDWLIVASVLIGMTTAVAFTKKYMRSVSDFLAAGRTAGRYIISMSQGMAMLGAITIIGMLEMNYIAGFTLRWWEFTNAVVIMLITVSGWVVYRFRETRALTMAQFFEIRYSRKFRVFAGLLAFVSGIINFGIFPAVGARFFIYFCGIPPEINFLGIEISSFPLVMIVLLAFALYFVFAGGQVAVIITDFIQGILVNAVFIGVIIYLLYLVDWNTIAEGVKHAPESASLINPFKTSKTEDFNFSYFFIGMLGLIYGKLSWQGTQGYNASAKSAHEAKMGEVLSNWRNIPQWGLFLVFVPVVAYVIMHHSDYSIIAEKVNGVLNMIQGKPLRSQLTVPMVLANILPVGMIGAFAAIMLAAFISTHDTYLHSWGSIFIQDVIMPFRVKPFEPKQHIRVLKYSIIGVSLFIFIFSMLFQQSEYIFLFFAITGAIFAGGSGAVIIGGLYWSKGTTQGAWWGMITGAVISVGGITVKQIYPDFPINGQWFWGIAMLASAVIYIVVSSLTYKEKFDMDKMLHRGKFASEDVVQRPAKGWRLLGMGKEFTLGDKVIYILTYVWTGVWTIIFIFGTIYNLNNDVSDSVWLSFWRYYVIINLAASIIVIIWFSIGGIKDLKKMIASLKSADRDETDDGFIAKVKK